MPKDHSATGSRPGRAAPELLLNLGLLVFHTLFFVQIYIFIFGCWCHVTFGALTSTWTLQNSHRAHASSQASPASCRRLQRVNDGGFTDAVSV